MPGPFEGVRVLEIGEGIGPPLGAMLLADLGAEVVKVEPPQGDRLRKTPGFHVLNRSKQGIVADLTTAEGQAKIQPLLRAADVVIIGGGPASHAARGLNADALRRENPRLIVIQAPMYGLRGPYADIEEDEALLGALAGAYIAQASYSGNAIYQTIPVGAAGHGVLVAQATAAALIKRERSGQGDVLEVRGLTAWHQYMASGYLSSSIQPIAPSAALRSPLGSATYGLFETSDHEWFFVGAQGMRDWLKFAAAFGLDDLLADPRFANGPNGVEDPQDMVWLRKHMEGVVGSKPLAHWEQCMIENDNAFGILQSREKYIEEEQVLLMEMVQPVDDLELGPTKQMGIPINAFGTPGAIRGGAPRLDPAAVPPDWKPRETAAPAAEETSSPLPLEGVVVLDVATWVAGSYGATFLADLGADVIKIEQMDGDPYRQLALGYLGCNRGKRSLAMDLRSPLGKEAFARLVSQAHIVLTNLRPAPAGRLGVDWETVHAINPNAIFVSATTNGRIGALKDRAAYDQVFEARSGMSYQQGGGGDPVILGMPVDLTTAASNAVACLAGLYHQIRTGESQALHTSLLQGGMTVAAPEFIFYPDRPSSYTLRPEPQGTAALRRAYKCRDEKWLFLSARKPEAWEALARALDQPGWLTRWTPAQAEAEPLDGDLTDAIAAGIGAQARDDAVERIQRAGVPCLPCLQAQEAFDHPHFLANDCAVAHHYPDFGGYDLGIVRQLGRYARFSGEVPPSGPTANLGEHSAEILRQFGYSSAEIGQMVKDRAILALDSAKV